MPKAEIVRFEDEVIKGGPIALPGALALLQQVRSHSAAHWRSMLYTRFLDMGLIHRKRLQQVVLQPLQGGLLLLLVRVLPSNTLSHRRPCNISE